MSIGEPHRYDKQKSPNTMRLFYNSVYTEVQKWSKLIYHDSHQDSGYFWGCGID